LDKAQPKCRRIAGDRDLLLLAAPVSPVLLFSFSFADLFPQLNASHSMLPEHCLKHPAHRADGVDTGKGLKRHDDFGLQKGIGSEKAASDLRRIWPLSRATSAASISRIAISRKLVISSFDQAFSGRSQSTPALSASVGRIEVTAATSHGDGLSPVR